MTSKTQLVKDEQLTYEELTALCRKQEEYIKELENKCNDTRPTIDVAQPDYVELNNRNMRLSDENKELECIIRALLYSLKKTNNERLLNEEEAIQFKEALTKEYKRAEKLHEELEVIKNDK